jgi:hypothetical protein
MKKKWNDYAHNHWIKWVENILNNKNKTLEELNKFIDDYVLIFKKPPYSF